LDTKTGDQEKKKALANLKLIPSETRAIFQKFSSQYKVVMLKTSAQQRQKKKTKQINFQS